MSKRSAIVLRMLLVVGSLFGWRAARAQVENSAADLKTYLKVREQLKPMELPALRAIAENAREKNVRRGLASYYIFLRSLGPEGKSPDGARIVKAFEEATDTFMDPASYVKLATVYADDQPDIGTKKDLDKAMRYLAIAWGIGDLSNKATGSNKLLSYIMEISLGLGDGLFDDHNVDAATRQKRMQAIGPDVEAACERFKKLYGLKVKKE